MLKRLQHFSLSIQKLHCLVEIVNAPPRNAPNIRIKYQALRYFELKSSGVLMQSLIIFTLPPYLHSQKLHKSIGAAPLVTLL